MHLKALRATLTLTLVPLGLAACSGYSSPASTSGSSSPTSSPPGSPAAAVEVQTGTATVAGSSKTVLTDSTGLTLYYRTTDTATTISCTGQCAANWPPLLLPSGSPTASASVTGTLTVLAGPNGRQVMYNGHALYRWKSDSAPGQATGQGVGGFLVATPELAVGAM